ncbi:MAG: type II secretion system ATPase GspE [Pseudomonadota bacterium]
MSELVDEPSVPKPGSEGVLGASGSRQLRRDPHRTAEQIEPAVGGLRSGMADSDQLGGRISAKGDGRAPDDRVAGIVTETTEPVGADSPTSDALLPFAFARRFGVVLLHRAPGAKQMTAACRGVPSFTTQAEIRRFAGGPVQLRKVDEEEFEALLTATYSRDSSQARQMVEDLGDEMDLASLAQSVPETEDLLEQEDDAPIIRLINALLAEAIRESASDIHIETFERDLVVRFRIDGVMREIVRPKRELAPLLVSRIKVMARLDIAEKRVPQDGRISLRIGGREVDVRVSTMPASSGERVVMRLLDKQAGRLKLDALGMLDTDLDVIRSIIGKPHGIFLVTGPTGSGKTTTLYSSLAELSANTINILTVEDPIEYNLPGIGQTQVNNKADMTFARGLRAMLRQDPDVVMVGEIRDLETAEIAVQASLTGHMVMSTLHTNTAVGAVTRLADMGVEPFLLSSSLVGVLAQRLVRTLCPDCKAPRKATPSELRFLQEESATVYEPVGCDHCGHSGYRGRTGIYEVVVIDETMRQLIHDRVSEQEMAAYARTRTPGIRDDGKAKVLAGVTSVAEVLKVTLDD